MLTFKKTEELIKVVYELKYDIRKKAQDVNKENIVKIDKLEMDIIELKEDNKMMAKHLRMLGLLLIQLNNNDKKVIINYIDTDDVKCDLCNYKCKK